MKHSVVRHTVGLGVVAVLALGIAACSSEDDSSDSPTTTVVAHPLDDQLRLNQMQVLGTHNSYHVAPDPALATLLTQIDPAWPRTLEYSHVPLETQFTDQGVRQVELDVFADPDGGLYSFRHGPPSVGQPGASGLPELDEPGFKVMHEQDVDYATTCLTFVACLDTVKQWSDANPGHAPLMILVEAKDGPIADPQNLGFVVPVPFDSAQFDALDAEVRSVFPPDQLITPDDVRGTNETLEEAVLGDGWPTLGQSRGKVMFTLDNASKRATYTEGHPSLRGRVFFTNATPGEPEAAFIERNDAGTMQAEITDLVRLGYVVRTRADAEMVGPAANDTTQRDAALASGAQWISTDYPVVDPRFPDYVVTIPGGTPGRCNPITAPPDCQSTDIENPEALSAP